MSAVNEEMPSKHGARSRVSANWIALPSALLIFAIMVAWHINIPGLYMDAVNPDYLVVDVIHGNPDANPVWVLPGNLAFGRWPLLTSAYHGTLTVWLALPLVGIFGPTVAALRASQALAGAAILVCVFFFLRREGSKSSIGFAWLPILALALDPVFIYSFRTQFYITLIPVAWLLAAVLAAERAFQTNPSTGPQESTAHYSPCWLFIAGLCTGLAVFGYFVFAFFLPALLIGLAVMCARTSPTMTRAKTLRAFLWAGLGLLAGVSGYIVGYLRVMQAENGPAGFVAWFSGYQHSIGAFAKHMSPLETVAYFARLIWRVFSNDWQHSLMFGDAWPEPYSALKVGLLLGLPVGIWAWREIQGSSSWRLRLILGLIVSFLAVAMAFGDRLAGHHFIGLLPLSYLALGIALADLADTKHARRSKTATALAPWTLLIAINLSGLYATDIALLHTHGRGLYSDAINHYASDAMSLRKDGKKEHVYMPDWGILLPFHYLTNGTIRHSADIDIRAMRNDLCGAEDVAVVLINSDVASRLDALTRRLQWTPPIERSYLDHEGRRVFLVGTFNASTRGQAQNVMCGDGRSH